MQTNRWINISRRVYARLLNLYPAAHRAEYGTDMLQVFTDQCRSASQAPTGLAFLALWMRTLVDLGINVVREHLTSPRSTLGGLENGPIQPLPWKGVALVLVPGLIFFASQVAQLTGQDWFFLMVYRAAYFLILPVLAAWAWTRKFPVWGLIPLGLLMNTLLSLGYRLQYLEYVTPGEVSPLLRWLAPILKTIPPTTLEIIPVILFLLAILALLWMARHRVGISGRAWVWLGVYAALVILYILANVYPILSAHIIAVNARVAALVRADNLKSVIDQASYYLYIYGGFLVLILLGALLAGRHGRLAALLPLGYLLPTILYGRISNDWPTPGTPEFTFMLTVAAAALAYRFLVALAGPLWIVRSASGQMQKRASAASLMVLVGIQAVFNLVMLFSGKWGGQQLTDAYFAIAGQLIVGAGLALALALYRNAPQPQVADQPRELSPASPSPT
jgi:hypothetical protein